MLDGDSAHGNPGEPAGDEWALDTDTDVVDQGAEDELEDVVADPVPESDEEIDEFEAGAEPDAVSAGPAVETEEVEQELEAEPVAAEDDEVSETEADEVIEPEVETSPLEAELDREMDRTSIDPARPAAIAPDAHEVTPPIDGYDALTIPQVMAKTDGLDVGQLNAVLEYERAHRNRKTLVSKLTRLTSEA